MNIKRIAVIAAIVLSAFIFLIIFALRGTDEDKTDVVAVNDITQSLAEQWDRLDKNDLPGLEYGIDYTVLDSDNSFIAATREGLNKDINRAVENRDTIVDIKSGNKIIGKLIIYNDTRDIWLSYRNFVLIVSVVFMVTAAALCIFYAIYIDRSVFRPFRKLQNFAQHVAQGNLDMPLDMDKNNIFGAFTESFDLMREELGRARENERIANQSKKELVASLSHDIKTPVASIMAVAELLQMKSADQEVKKQLQVIGAKADQINTLITNLFNATLEELHELSVSLTEQPSLILPELIRNADYDRRAEIPVIPECIISVDVPRLAQVIDNIISNSYKYAGTSIEVASRIRDGYLEVAIKDFGPGVSADELPLLFNKYYRAKNSSGKSGTGLGLYISKYLMNKMGGDICCEQKEDGFSFIIKILIP